MPRSFLVSTIEAETLGLWGKDENEAGNIIPAQASGVWFSFTDNQFRKMLYCTAINLRTKLKYI